MRTQVPAVQADPSTAPGVPRLWLSRAASTGCPLILLPTSSPHSPHWIHNEQVLSSSTSPRTDLSQSARCPRTLVTTWEECWWLRAGRSSPLGRPSRSTAVSSLETCSPTPAGESGLSSVSTFSQLFPFVQADLPRGGLGQFFSLLHPPPLLWHATCCPYVTTGGEEMDLVHGILNSYYIQCICVAGHPSNVPGAK